MSVAVRQLFDLRTPAILGFHLTIPGDEFILVYSCLYRSIHHIRDLPAARLAGFSTPRGSTSAHAIQRLRLSGRPANHNPGRFFPPASLNHVIVTHPIPVELWRGSLYLWWSCFLRQMEAKYTVFHPRQSAGHLCLIFGQVFNTFVIHSGSLYLIRFRKLTSALDSSPFDSFLNPLSLIFLPYIIIISNLM